MVSRLTALALVATGLAGVAMASAAACGGDAFTFAGDASTNDAGTDGSKSDASAEGGETFDSGDAADDTLTVALDGPPESSASDAIAFPDVIEEAPAHCSTDQYECIPSLPAGWDGPFEVYRGPTPAPASCTANYFPSYQGGYEIDAGPAACGCSCATATGVQCSAVTATFFVSTAGVTGCTSLGKCTSDQLPSGQCVNGINAANQCSSLLGSTLFTASAPTADGGSCAPTPTTTLPDASFITAARACISSVAVGQVDCPAGSVCAPKPALPYADSTLCIAQPGDVPCPATDYTDRFVSYGSIADGRRCAGCTCGPVTGSSCSGYVDVTPSSTSGSPCGSSNAVRYITPQSCAGVDQPGDFKATITPQPGTCAPSTAMPAGAAAPAGPTTFCCQ